MAEYRFYSGKWATSQSKRSGYVQLDNPAQSVCGFGAVWGAKLSADCGQVRIEVGGWRMEVGGGRLQVLVDE